MTGRSIILSGIWHGLAVAGVAMLLAGCANTPVPPSAVVPMTSREAAAEEGFPPRNTVWRLDERELKALGPILPAPDPPPAPVRLVPEPVYPLVISPSIGYYDSGWSFGLGIGFGHAYRPYWPRYSPYRYYHR